MIYIEYASPAWAPNLSVSHYNTLQTIQNKALRIITGCTQTSHTNYLHYETKILPIRDYINMRGTQFLAAAVANSSHPCNYMRNHPQTYRNIKTIPHTLYTTHLNSIPVTRLTDIRNTRKEIHTNFTTNSLYSNLVQTQY